MGGQSGSPPVARITTSGFSDFTRSLLTSTPDTMKAPAAFACSAKGPTKAPISQRSSMAAERGIWPPRYASFSYRVTLWPACAAVRAAERPAGPPPTTKTFFGFAAFFSGGTSNSRPALGLTMHSTGSMLKMRSRHPWLQPMQGTISFARPVMAFRGNSGSARSARETDEIGAAVADDLLGKTGVVDSVAGDDGFCDSSLYAACRDVQRPLSARPW